ncbi:MAG TPA: Uma2 family endonuclease [Urbifossiella sp.]|nr:Uma2 family endonuclease [Urbifossiella sp.]
MSAKPQQKRMTVAEYLAHERAATYKSDFIDGRLYPVHNPYGPPDPTGMAGGSREHNLVKDNLAGELFGLLKPCGCTIHVSDQRVRVSPSGRYTYPDIVIVCDPPEYAGDDRDALTNPQIVIEVLSNSTERYDRGLKFAEYQRQPTIREIVLVAQGRVRAERYVRQPDGTWTYQAFDNQVGHFELATVPVRIPMSDVYRGVDLAAYAPPPEIEPDAD